MDDFLHNLRSGKLKQADRNRRDYSEYKGPQRRAGNERRKPDYYAKVTSENFSLVKDSLEVLANCQKRIEGKLSELNETGLRIAVALEALAGFGKGHSLMPTNTPPSESATAEKTKLEKEDQPRLLDIISSMRGEGKSWEKIARHMDEINIPTVSGKGKWRGVSIKKFWDTFSSAENM